MKQSNHPLHTYTRRRFLYLSAVCGASLILGAPLPAKTGTPRSQSLSFYHTHTRETLHLSFDPLSPCTQTRRQLNNFLRDFRTGEIHPIDPQLLAILSSIQGIGGSSGTYEVISGYRSPKTNARLRDKSSGVAKKSYHTRGRAIDIRLTDLKSSTLRDIACSMKKGGVGYYSQSDFVHLDTGRVRRW